MGKHFWETVQNSIHVQITVKASHEAFPHNDRQRGFPLFRSPRGRVHALSGQEPNPSISDHAETLGTEYGWVRYYRDAGGALG